MASEHRAGQKSGSGEKRLQNEKYASVVLFVSLNLFLLKTGGFYLQRPKHWKFN